MRLLATGAAIVLTILGVWSNGAASGYEHGKADAANSLRLYGVTVMNGDGTCTVYDKPGQYVLPWRGPARAYVSLLVRPQ